MEEKKKKEYEKMKETCDSSWWGWFKDIVN